MKTTQLVSWPAFIALILGIIFLSLAVRGIIGADPPPLTISARDPSMGGFTPEDFIKYQFTGDLKCFNYNCIETPIQVQLCNPTLSPFRVNLTNIQPQIISDFTGMSPIRPVGSIIIHSRENRTVLINGPCSRFILNNLSLLQRENYICNTENITGEVVVLTNQPMIGELAIPAGTCYNATVPFREGNIPKGARNVEWQLNFTEYRGLFLHPFFNTDNYTQPFRNLSEGNGTVAGFNASIFGNVSATSNYTGRGLLIANYSGFKNGNWYNLTQFNITNSGDEMFASSTEGTTPLVEANDLVCDNTDANGWTGTGGGSDFVCYNWSRNTGIQKTIIMVEVGEDGTGGTMTGAEFYVTHQRPTSKTAGWNVSEMIYNLTSAQDTTAGSCVTPGSGRINLTTARTRLPQVGYMFCVNVKSMSGGANARLEELWIYTANFTLNSRMRSTPITMSGTMGSFRIASNQTIYGGIIGYNVSCDGGANYVSVNQSGFDRIYDCAVNGSTLVYDITIEANSTTNSLSPVVDTLDIEMFLSSATPSNLAPSVQNVSFIPSGNILNTSTINASFSCVDDSNATCEYITSWIRNGTKVEVEHFTVTLNANRSIGLNVSIVRNQTLILEINVTDGSLSNVTNFTMGTVNNSVPELYGLGVSPWNPINTSVINASALCRDNDTDACTVNITITRNFSTVMQRLNLIVTNGNASRQYLNTTTRSENLTFAFRVSDGAITMPEQNVSVGINNSIPELYSAGVSPFNPVNSSRLNFSVLCRDNDSDPCVINASLFRNLSDVQERLNVTITNDNATFYYRNASRRDDNVTVAFRASDGLVGTSEINVSVGINNSIPVIVSFTINASDPLASVVNTSIINMSFTRCDDNDSDQCLVNITFWRNVSVIVQQHNVSANSTLGFNATYISGRRRGDNITVSIRFTDGIINGSGGYIEQNATVITINNAPPTAPVPNLPSIGLIHNANFTPSWNASVDNDSDSIVYLVWIDGSPNVSVSSANATITYPPNVMVNGSWNVTANDSTTVISGGSNRSYAIDTIAPVLTNQSISCTANTCTIGWNASEFHNVTIRYGLTTSPSSNFSNLSFIGTGYRNVTVPGLSAQNNWYFVILVGDNVTPQSFGNSTVLNASTGADPNPPGGSGGGGSILSILPATVPGELGFDASNRSWVVSPGQLFSIQPFVLRGTEVVKVASSIPLKSCTVTIGPVACDPIDGGFKITVDNTPYTDVYRKVEFVVKLTTVNGLESPYEGRIDMIDASSGVRFGFGVKLHSALFEPDSALSLIGKIAEWVFIVEEKTVVGIRAIPVVGAGFLVLLGAIV